MHLVAARANNFDDRITPQRKDFDCLTESALKLSAHKCVFRMTKSDYLGSAITPKEISSKTAKIEILLGQIKIPNTVKQVNLLFGFVQFKRNFVPNLGEKLLPFHKHLRKENSSRKTNDHHESLNTLKTDISGAIGLTLRSSKPGLQYMNICDANFHGTG